MVNAAIAGEIDAGLVGVGGFSSQLGPEGKLRALAITTEERSPSLPEVPALREIAKGYEAGSWFGLFAPVGTPAEAIRRLNEAVNTALKEPAMRQALLSTGTIPTGGSAAALRGHLLRDHKRFGAEIQRLGVQPQ